MKMQPVVFLVQYPGEIGKPKPPDHEQKENDKVEIAFLIERFFEFHFLSVSVRYLCLQPLTIH